MATQSHRRSLAPAVAKRHTVAMSENSGGKVTTTAQLGKKRPPLSNLSNQRHAVGSAPSIYKGKKGYANDANIPRSSIPALVNTKAKTVVPPLKTSDAVVSSLKTSDAIVSSLKTSDAIVSSLKTSDAVVASLSSKVSVSSSMDISPSPSDAQSSSMDSMSICESLESPEVEYLDGNDVAALHSIEKKTSDNLHISDHMETSGNFCKREILAEMEVDKVVNIDGNYIDPQFCATVACDIYKHLRETETQKRPSPDFMEKIQKDINASMRAILIDWLVEVAEEYRLVPDTLYLTVNYIDRYLSGNAMNRQRLQLLGVACMMIAAKYEEICAPQVEEFCYITDNTYFKDEVLQMESTVLNFLKFEMTATTTKCFLRRFVRAAQVMSEVSSMQLDCLSNYVAELSLLEYNMIQYAPSLTAASAIFLAKYIPDPSQSPWNSTLKHYTLYEPSDLYNCVKALHQLYLSSPSSGLPAIREKYSQHKYKFVAKKYCPPSIPQAYFQSLSS